MHYDTDWLAEVHAGIPSLPGKRGKAFLNLRLGAEAFQSRRFSYRLTVSLWVKIRAYLSFSGRER